MIMDKKLKYSKSKTHSYCYMLKDNFDQKEIIGLINGPAEIRTQGLTVISRALHLAKLRAQFACVSCVAFITRHSKYASKYLNISLGIEKSKEFFWNEFIRCNFLALAL